jgi:hypothetical protein
MPPPTIPVQEAARRLFWPWLALSALGILWTLGESPFSAPRRIAYVTSAVLPILGALGAMRFGPEQSRRRIASADWRQILALSFTYLGLLVLVPLVIQMRALSKPDLGPASKSDHAMNAPAKVDGDNPVQSAADRELDSAWSLLSVFMGFTVFAHGRIIGKQQE